MDVNFCVHYKGNGNPPTNRYCRECPEAHEACDKLWAMVVKLSKANNGNAVKLPGTRAEMYPNPNTWNIVHLRINSQWNLGKEDFLYFISTGYAQWGLKNQRDKLKVSPSMTMQEPYVQSIIEAIGGNEIPEIENVRQIQVYKNI